LAAAFIYKKLRLIGSNLSSPLPAKEKTRMPVGARKGYSQLA